MFSPAPLMTASLVPAGRFGSLLFRERVRASLSGLELSRATGARWLPDELLDIERGAREIDDDDIAILCSAYGIDAGPWRPSGAMRLVLDRSSSSDFTTDERRRELAEFEPDAIIDRFLAVAVLVGMNAELDPDALSVLADALELTEVSTHRLVSERLDATQADLGTCVASLRERISVPRVGALVAETMGGTLVAVRAPH